MSKSFDLKVGLDKMNKSPDTRLLYVTTGILLNELAGDGRIQRYTHIIIDEVPEMFSSYVLEEVPVQHDYGT